MTDSADSWERPPAPAQGPRRAGRLVLLVGVALAGGFFVAQGGGVAPTPGGLVIEEASGPAAPTPTPTTDVPLAEHRGRHLVVSRDGWEEAVVSPLEQRSGALAVWTGEQLFVWGGIGERPFADGALYDPATRDWSPVAASDLAPRSRAVGTWSGTEVIVAGGRLYNAQAPYPSAAGRATDAAAYNPASDTWRVLPPLPFPPRRVFTSGNELYAVSLQARASPVAVLDAASSTWRPAPLDAAAPAGSSSVSRGGPRSSRGLAAAPPAPQRRVAPPAPVGKARHR